MITANNNTEIFCLADDFCKYFDAMMATYTLKTNNKRTYHRNSTTSKAEIMLIMTLFHDSGHRCLKHFSFETALAKVMKLFRDVTTFVWD